MSKLGTITFKKLEEEHKFSVHNLDSSWNSVSVVYVVTKRKKTEGGCYSHSVIYVGQTGDLKERFSNHHKEKCFSEKNGDCLCLLGEKDEDKRLSIESEMIEKYTPPCNG